MLVGVVQTSKNMEGRCFRKRVPIRLTRLDQGDCLVGDALYFLGWRGSKCARRRGRKLHLPVEARVPSLNQLSHDVVRPEVLDDLTGHNGKTGQHAGPGPYALITLAYLLGSASRSILSP